MQSYSVDERDQDSIKKIWNDMSAGKQYDSPYLRQVIKESWLRCQNYGLSPYSPKIFSLTDQSLKLLSVVHLKLYLKQHILSWSNCTKL